MNYGSYKNWEVLVFVLFFGAMFFFAGRYFAPKNQTDTSVEYQAFLERDNAGIMQDGSYGGIIADAQQTRRENHIKQQEGMFPVDTIVKVTVSKTQDTDDYVITMTNVDGEIASLWMTGNNVSGLTNY